MKPISQLTREDIKPRLLVFAGISIGCVADNHAGLPNGSVPDQHTADCRGLQLIRLGQPASRGDSGFLIEIIHLRWHVDLNPKVQECRAPSYCLTSVRLYRSSLWPFDFFPSLGRCSYIACSLSEWALTYRLLGNFPLRQVVICIAPPTNNKRCEQVPLSFYGWFLEAFGTGLYIISITWPKWSLNQSRLTKIPKIIIW